MERQAEVQEVEGCIEVHGRVQCERLGLVADGCWELFPCCPVQGHHQKPIANVVV